MEVTNVMDHVTHAIVSSGQSRSFQVSDNAEFFHIISDALYSDKPLAVVREVLCNAWDAHIENGLTEIAVEVDIDDDYMTFTDFGVGIADNMIQEIYGTFGNSTKQHDGNQTGGFGLGSKAPFCWAEHFEVTSNHMGIKTIYSMAKSSAMVGGKPSITPLVSIPTDDTGISVKVETKGAKSTFEELVQKIALFGDMKVSLNGKILPRINFSELEYNFLIIQKKQINLNDLSTDLYIRYGNVVYPVEASKFSDFKKINYFLESIRTKSYHYRSNNTDYAIIIQAEPHTISVTPSRESLSMSNKTIATIEGLIQNVAEILNTTCNKKIYSLMENELNKAINETIDNSFNLKNGPNYKLIIEPTEFPNKEAISSQSFLYLKNDNDFAKAYMSAKPTSFFSVQKNIIFRLQKYKEKNIGRKKLLNIILKSLQSKNYFGYEQYRGLVQKTEILNIYRYIDKDPNLDRSCLFIHTKKESGYCVYNQRYKGKHNALVEPKKFAPSSIEKLLPFIRGLVILSHNKMDISERAPNFPLINKTMRTTEECLVYIVPRKQEKVDAALALFNKLGFTVLDLTKRADFEPEPVKIEKVKSSEPKPKRTPGHPTVSSLIGPGLKFHTRHLLTKDVKKLTDPEFVIVLGQRQNGFYNFDEFTETDTDLLINHFGDKGVIVPTTSVAQKYYQKGALTAHEFLSKKVIDVILNDPKTDFFMQNDPNFISSNNSTINLKLNQIQIIQLIYEYDEFQKEFPEIKKTDPYYGKLITSFLNASFHYKYNYSSEYQRILTKIQNSIPNPDFIKFVQMLKSNSFFEFFNVLQIKLELSKTLIDPKEKSDLIRKTINLIKG